MSVLTTADFADQLIDAFVSQGVEFSDEAAAKLTVLGLFTDWLGGEDAMPAALGRQLSTQIGLYNADVLNRYLYWTIEASGGPYGDGTFDLTLPDGTVVRQPSLKKFLATTVKGDRGAGILGGIGAPPAGTGNDGDIWIDVSNGDFYGPKAGGSWGSPVLRSGLLQVYADTVAARNAAQSSQSAAAGSASAAAGSATSASGSANTATTGANTATAAAAAAEGYANAALNGPGTIATSASTLTLGTGLHSLEINEADKSFAKGQFVRISADANPANQMNALVRAYDPVTRDMDVETLSPPSGSGTFSLWHVSLAGSGGVDQVAGLAGVITAAALRGALALTVGDITNYAADQTSRHATTLAAANAQAIAFAVAL